MVFEPKVAVVGTPHRGMLAAVEDIFTMTCKEMLTATACAEQCTIRRIGSAYTQHYRQAG